MQVIDAHIHVWTPDLVPEPLRRTWARSAANRSFPARDEEQIVRRVTIGIADPEAAHVRGVLSRAGVAAGVVVGVDFGVVAGQEATVPNREAIARLARLTGGLTGGQPRLSFIAGVDPRRPDAGSMLSEALDELGAVGLKLYPPAGFSPGDPRCIALCDVARERGVPVLVHTGTAPGGLDSRLGWPGHMADVQQAYPDLNVVLCHAGYPAWFDDAVAFALSHPRTFLEISRWQNLAASAWPLFRERMAYAHALLGARRIVFASDLACGASGVDQQTGRLTRWIDQIVSLREDSLFSAEELELILWRNAARLFGLGEATSTVAAAGLDGNP
jgi:predicted TIM-barrel fold metal-dependent hydrolase